MKCAEFKEQLEAFALHELTPAEEAACARHLTEVQVHEGCLEALAATVDTLGALAAAPTPVAPGPQVWAAIEAKLTPRAPRRALRPQGVKAWSFWTVVAAIAVLLVVGVWNRWLHTGGVREVRRDALALLGDPATQIFPLRPPGSTPGAPLAGRVLYHVGWREAVVVFHGAPAAAGKDYELWVIRGDRKLGAGLIRPDSNGDALVQVPADLLSDGKPDALAVTLEPEGGGTAPRGSIVLVGVPEKG